MNTNTGMDKFEKDVIMVGKDGKGELIITFIKHSSLMFEYKGMILYVDPVMEFADFKKMPKADYILITHDHYDHYDSLAVEALKKETTKIISNKLVVENFKEGIALKYGESIYFTESINVMAVPAYNTSQDKMQFHPKNRDNGYVLNFEGTKIYVAGDTEYIPEMNELKDKIDIAFLPVNQPWTMNIENAIKAVKNIKPKIFYPYHYGQSEIITPIEELKERLKDENIEVRIRQMQ